MSSFDPFHDFFSSLSRISQLAFQVWDGNGLVVSTGLDGAENSDQEARRNFSALIMNEGSYQYARGLGSYPMFGVPIRYGHEVIASLIALNSNSHPRSKSRNGSGKKTHTPQDMEMLLTPLAHLMEDSWANQHDVEEMAEELSNNFEDLSLYTRISTHMRSLKFSGAMLESLIEELLETLRVDLVFVEMPNRWQFNYIVSCEELSDDTFDQQAFAHGLIRAILPGAPSLEEDYFIVNDSSQTPGFEGLHSDPYRFLAVKVAHEDAFDGWLGLVSFNMEEIFRQSELRLLQSMGKQISVLLANADLYNELQHFVISVVKSLVFAIEAKDIYTRGHSERVNRYSMLMAGRLQLDDEQKDMLNWASILHDIGKIGIPERVLNKEGPLNDGEYAIIKGHPQKGRNILEPLSRLSGSLPGILHHHERCDGNGYPRGLEGDEIPLQARIIAVADTFDAITSNRAYRLAKSPEEALAIMKRVAGTQLDAHLVGVFLEVYETILKQEFQKHHDIR